METMRSLLLLGIICLAGCQNVYGPFEARKPLRVDAPGIGVAEQEYRARDRWAIPDESPGVGPSSGNLIPYTLGR
jgi:hypothetical protein